METSLETGNCLWCGVPDRLNKFACCAQCDAQAEAAWRKQTGAPTVVDWLFTGMLIILAAAIVGLAIAFWRI